MTRALTYAVVTPARNEAENLKRLAAALAAQTRKPKVWAVVEDGSTDGTWGLLTELATRHEWLLPVTPPAKAQDELAPRAPRRSCARRLSHRRAGAARPCRRGDQG